MKKSVLILILILALALTACGGNEGTDAQMEITRDPKETTAQVEAAEVATEAAQVEEESSFDGPFIFQNGSVKLLPGDPFDASVLPEADSVYEVPSCAIEGTDNVYNYGAYEVTAFKSASGEQIYSVYFLDATLSTKEGISLGDSLEKVIETYGEGYQVNNTEYFYTSEGTVLSFIVQNNVVMSIEYRMDV